MHVPSLRPHSKLVAMCATAAPIVNPAAMLLFEYVQEMVAPSPPIAEPVKKGFLWMK